MTLLSLDDLATVNGGEYNNPAFGRCGLGDKDVAGIVGNVYTPQCAAHDAAVRDAQNRGAGPVMSQVQALPLLPAAVGSWIQNRFS